MLARHLPSSNTCPFPISTVVTQYAPWRNGVLVRYPWSCPMEYTFLCSGTISRPGNGNPRANFRRIVQVSTLLTIFGIFRTRRPIHNQKSCQHPSKGRGACQQGRREWQRHRPACAAFPFGHWALAGEAPQVSQNGTRLGAPTGEAPRETWRGAPTWGGDIRDISRVLELEAEAGPWDERG